MGFLNQIDFFILNIDCFAVLRQTRVPFGDSTALQPGGGPGYWDGREWRLPSTAVYPSHSSASATPQHPTHPLALTGP